MEGLVGELRSILEADKFLKCVSCDPDQLEQMLSARESEEFDTAWTMTFALVDQLEIDEEHARLVNQLREETFKKAFSVCGSAEVAGYVSDDFELIAKSSLLPRGDAFAELLKTEYMCGNFPHQIG